MALGLTAKGVKKAFDLVSKQYAGAKDVEKVKAYLDHVKHVRKNYSLQGNQTQQPGYLSPLYDDPKTIALRKLAHNVPRKSTAMAKQLGFKTGQQLAKAIDSGDAAIGRRGYIRYVKQDTGNRKGRGAAELTSKLSGVPLKVRHESMVSVYDEIGSGKLNLEKTLEKLKLDGKSVNVPDAAKILGIEPYQLQNTMKGLIKKKGSNIVKTVDGAYRINLFNLAKEAKKVFKAKEKRGSTGSTPDYIKTMFRTKWDALFKKDFPMASKEVEIFKKELNKGVARADEKKVVDHIKGVARSLNDKDMGLGAFNAYVQDVKGGRHMNSLNRKELNKLMDEFLENQRQRPDYFDVINIFGRPNLQQLAAEMNTPGIIKGSKGTYFDKLYDNVFDDGKYLTKISDEATNIKDFFIKGSDFEIDPTMFNLANLKDLQKLTIGSSAHNYRGFNTSMFNTVEDLGNSLKVDAFRNRAIERLKNIDAQIAKRSGEVVDKYKAMAALREREGFLTPALPQGIKNVLTDAGVKNVFKKGGRVGFDDGGDVVDFDELIRINIEDHGMENKDAIDEAVKTYLSYKNNNYLSGGAVGVGGNSIGGVGTAIDNQVGTFQSILSGIGAGLIDIPKGAFSLGASLLDLGLGTNNAAQVEAFFDNLTTLDEKAEATTAGKITRILTNLGIPGTAAFKTASGLTKRALLAKEKGNYFKFTKNLDDKLEKTMTAKGRLFTTLGGVAGVGASDAIFVGDPERVGTLGDAFNIGPTRLKDNSEDDAAREVMNRLKFGVDSAFLGGIIGGTGSAITQAVQRSKQLNRNNDIIDKILEYTTPQGAKTREFFDTERVMIGKRSAELNRAQVLHRQMDKHIDGLFPILKQITSAEVRGEREKVVKIINDALTSSDKGPTVDFIRGVDDEIIGGRFSLGDMSPQALNKVKDIKGLNFDEVVNIMQQSRDIIGDTFSDIGSNIIRAGKKTDEALGDTLNKFNDFKEAFKVKSLDYINNTYRIFKNGEIDALSSYKPTDEAVQNTKQLFIQLSKQRNAADPTVKVLTDSEAAYAVDRLLAESKKYPKFLTEGEVIPMVKDKTGFLKDLAYKDFDKPLLPLNKITNEKVKGFDVSPREIIEELLGKVEDPSATILSSMNNLSLIRQKHNFYGELYDQFKNKQFFETREAAAAVFGDRNVLNQPIRMMATDKNGKLFTEAVNPLNGLYTSKGNQEALEGINRNLFTWTENNNMLSNFYNNFILYPKATSQLAKTVLSPVTHARNLISAGAFAAANGLIPLVNREALNEAYGAFAQVGKKGTDAYNKRYQRLLELGVVNSSARLGDLTEILADVNFGARASQIRALRGVTRAGGKVKQFATDLYTAEDDFWKMYTFAAERQRIASSLRNAGIDGTAFARSERNNLGRTFASFDEYLDEAAADIVRNNVPNYDYVSNFIKDLRRAPIGNFVSFPAEIIRTSINIVKKGLDDFNYVAPNGTKPFRNVGMTRLAGFGLTTAAIPYGLVEAFKAAQGVTGVEMDALRRFVPDWSKNSNLIPIRGEDGKLKYVDFSHANAYDTISRPLKTVLNAIADGRTDNDTVMEDFVQGVVESTSELGAPFISESIWTQGISDIFVRKGRTKDGRRLYTEQTPFGEKFSIAVKHLAETQYPGSLAQADRIFNSITRNPDEYGRTYELADEVLGITGLRAVEVDPVQSMKFKIADFRTGVNNARREFTAPLLRGGVVDAETIIDRYQVANQALFNVQKEMSKDYYGAILLGATPKSLNAEFADRVSNIQLRAIIKGNFKPFIPSENIEKAFRENAKKIGGVNTYNIAKETIRRMAKQYSRLSLFDGQLPTFDNPYRAPLLPDLGLSNAPAPTSALGLQTPGVSGISNNIQTTALKGQRVFGPNDTVFGG